MPLTTHRFLALCGLAILVSCSTVGDSGADDEVRSFAWSDRTRPLSYPGPLTEGDSAFDLLSLRLIANLAHAELDSVRRVANDSLFANVAESPYMSQLEGVAQLEAWRKELGDVSYHAFNVRGVHHQGTHTHFSYVFVR